MVFHTKKHIIRLEWIHAFACGNNTFLHVRIGWISATRFVSVRGVPAFFNGKALTVKSSIRHSSRAKRTNRFMNIFREISFISWLFFTRYWFLWNKKKKETCANFGKGISFLITYLMSCRWRLFCVKSGNRYS